MHIRDLSDLHLDFSLPGSIMTWCGRCLKLNAFPRPQRPRCRLNVDSISMHFRDLSHLIVTTMYFHDVSDLSHLSDLDLDLYQP